MLDSTDAPIAGAVPTYTPTDPGLLGIGPGAFLHSLGPLGSTLLIAAYSNGVTRVADTVAVTVDAFSSPSGTVVDSLGTPSGVFGVAASTSRVYVSTLIGGGPLLRLDLPVQSFDSPIGHVGAGLAVAFNPVGNTAFVAVFDQDSVAIVNATANSLDSYVTTHILGTPRDVIVSPDGQRVYVATDYTQIYVINATSKSVIDSVYVPGLPNHFTFHPSKPLLYVSLDNAQVAEINTDSGKAVRFFHTGSLNQGTAVAPDGGELYNVTENNELFVYDLTSGNLVADVHGLGGYGLVASPDGKRLYVAGGPNVKIVDRLTRTLVDSSVVGGAARRITLSRDGGTAFVTNEAGWVNIIY